MLRERYENVSVSTTAPFVPVRPSVWRHAAQPVSPSCAARTTASVCAARRRRLHCSLGAYAGHIGKRQRPGDHAGSSPIINSGVSQLPRPVQSPIATAIPVLLAACMRTKHVELSCGGPTKPVGSSCGARSLGWGMLGHGSQVGLPLKTQVRLHAQSQHNTADSRLCC